MRRKRLLLGAVALTAALTAMGYSSTPNGSQAVDSAKNQTDTSKDSDSRGSGNEDTNKAAGVNRNVFCTLTLTTWDVAVVRIFEELDMEGRFQEFCPDVEIDIEEFNAGPEYLSSMKIRSSASEFPGLMFHKSDSMNRYSEYLVDLMGTEASKNNQITSEYAADGKVLGISDRRASDYVYHWIDMFDEAGAEVPETWDEFVETSEKPQEHFGSQDSNFGAIYIGTKDAWLAYPLMEYSPVVQSEDSYYWNAMTTENAPFVEGADIHTVYDKIHDLFQKGVLGKDSLGTTYDQDHALFVKKKGAITLNSPMFLTAYKADGYGTVGMSTFCLPFRNGSQDEPNLVTQGDCLLTAINSSENPRVAKALLEFYFSETWYPDYIAPIDNDGTMTPYARELDPVLQTASEFQPEVKFVTYGVDSNDFINIVSETKLDCKQLGAETLTDGFGYAKRCEELNQTWAEARIRPGLK